MSERKWLIIEVRGGESMLIGPVLLLMLVAGRNSAPEEVTIREQEVRLASALRTGNRAILYRLSDSKLHVSWECGSVVDNFRTTVYREDWVDYVSQLRMTTYDAKISNLRLIRSQKSDNSMLQYGDLATVSVKETINFLTPQGETSKKYLVAQDTWAKQEGVWKLANRSYTSQACHDGPHLRFP